MKDKQRKFQPAYMQLYVGVVFSRLFIDAVEVGILHLL